MQIHSGRGRAQQSALSAGRCCPRAGAEHAALATGKKWGTGPETRRRRPEPGRNGTSLIPKLRDVKQATRPRLEEMVMTLRAVTKRKCSHARLEHDLQAPSSRRCPGREGGSLKERPHHLQKEALEVFEYLKDTGNTGALSLL